MKLDVSGHPILDRMAFVVDAYVGKMHWSRLTWLSELLAASVEPFDECLLWVSLWGVWASSENWHLFYRLRESYGERRQLHDAPGHLFLKHERADLATFIELALQFGWDFSLLPSLDYATLFVSHDGFLEFHTNQMSEAERVKDLIEGATLRKQDGANSGT